VSVNASTGNAGTILFDAYHWDDANGSSPGRTPMPDQRWTTDVALYAPLDGFVGPGWIENLTLVSGDGAADQEVIVYDTDQAQNDDDRIVAHLHNTAANETVDVSAPRIYCQNGAYVELVEGEAVISTSNASSPRAIMQISPTYFGSRSQIVSYGLRR
jgi:hypothetical protein